jgi:hypothetical protein
VRKIDQRPTVGLCSVSTAALGGSRGGQQVDAEAPLWLLAQQTSQHAGRSSRFCPAFDSEATRGSLVGPVWHALPRFGVLERLKCECGRRL